MSLRKYPVQETILSGTEWVWKSIWYRRRASAVPNGFENVSVCWGVPRPAFSAFAGIGCFADVIAYQQAGGIKNIDVVEAFDLVERNRV